MLQGGVLIHQESVKYGLPWDGLVGHAPFPNFSMELSGEFVFVLKGPTVAIQF